MNPKLPVNGPLAWSAASLLAIVLIIAMTLPALGRAALGPGLSGADVDHDFARLMDEHETMTTTYRERFDGRSVFFKPPRKPPPVVYAPPPPTPKRNEPAAPPPPKPEPTRPVYAGPSIGGIIGDRVYFDGDLRVDVGQEINGIQVISVNAPWGATVKYRDWEYELPLFEHAGFFDEEAAESDTKLGGFIEEDTPVKSSDDDEAAGLGAAVLPGSDVAVPAASAKVRGRSRATPVTSDE